MNNNLGFIAIILAIVTIITTIVIIAIPNNDKSNNINQAAGGSRSDKVIVKIEEIQNSKTVSTITVATNGDVVHLENKKRIDKIELSDDVINNLLQLIDQVDKNKYIEKNTNVAITSGKVVTINNSKGGDIVIKSLYRENYSDAAVKILTILKNNNLY